MAIKSIYLCNEKGVDVASALVDKLYRPDTVELWLGSSVLHRIREISHGIKDGRPVVDGEDTAGKRITFQFSPDNTPFSSTAIDADGQPVCF